MTRVFGLSSDLAEMRHILGVLVLLVSAQTEAAHLTLSADRNDIMSHRRIPRNAGRCVLRDCMWPRDPDGKVYVPYAIADHYSSQDLDVITQAINSFSSSTCIRFFPRTKQMDFLYIRSLSGCSSYVGRQGGFQTVSLNRHGCINLGIIQHELLHALGFNHEHCRADRDQHIRVLLQNVIRGEEFNFNKVDTLNQETPYDYDSVMHYNRFAFSQDSRSPTMEAVPDPSAVFGTARRMSRSDINRVNLLYCSKPSQPRQPAASSP